MFCDTMVTLRTFFSSTAGQGVENTKWPSVLKFRLWNLYSRFYFWWHLIVMIVTVSTFRTLFLGFLTGISQEDYRAAVRAGADIVWFCPSCSPVLMLIQWLRAPGYQSLRLTSWNRKNSTLPCRQVIPTCLSPLSTSPQPSQPSTNLP